MESLHSLLPCQINSDPKIEVDRQPRLQKKRQTMVQARSKVVALSVSGSFHLPHRRLLEAFCCLCSVPD